MARSLAEPCSTLLRRLDLDELQIFRSLYLPTRHAKDVFNGRGIPAKFSQNASPKRKQAQPPSATNFHSASIASGCIDVSSFNESQPSSLADLGSVMSITAVSTNKAGKAPLPEATSFERWTPSTVSHRSHSVSPCKKIIFWYWYMIVSVPRFLDHTLPKPQYQNYRKLMEQQSPVLLCITL